jgi:hypothetical protein
MARVLRLLPSALIAARGGMSANAFYRTLREQGEAPRRSEALQLYKIARGIVDTHAEEPFRPLGAVPTGNDIALWPTRRAAGIVQTVTLTYRDATTGQLRQTWWSIKTEAGMAREAAIAAAVDAYSDHAVSYGQELIGAVHTSTYRYAPGLVE